MSDISASSKEFLGTLEHQLQSEPEILVLIRFSRAAGKKSFEFFSSIAALSERLRQLPASTAVTAFTKPQLPLRGVVDDAFIASCLSGIPEGSEFLVVETAPRTAGGRSWFHHSEGESHAELRGALEDSRGNPVAAGVYPVWWEQSPNTISAIVPDERGEVVHGIY